MTRSDVGPDPLVEVRQRLRLLVLPFALLSLLTRGLLHGLRSSGIVLLQRVKFLLQTCKFGHPLRPHFASLVAQAIAKRDTLGREEVKKVVTNMLRRIRVAPQGLDAFRGHIASQKDP